MLAGDLICEVLWKDICEPEVTVLGVSGKLLGADVVEDDRSVPCDKLRRGALPLRMRSVWEGEKLPTPGSSGSSVD